MGLLLDDRNRWSKSKSALQRYPLTSWLSSRVVSDRTIANSWACRAVRGSSSLNRIPGSLVAIGLDGPRISTVASGFGSKVSCCGGPPCIHRKIQLLALPNEVPRSLANLGTGNSTPRADAPSSSLGSDSPVAALKPPTPSHSRRERDPKTKQCRAGRA